MNDLIQSQDDGKIRRPDLIVDDGGDMNLLIHEGKKVEDLFLKDCTSPDPISTENAEFNIFQTIIKFQLEGGDTDIWNKIVNRCMGVYDNTTKGAHYLYTNQKKGTNHKK